MRKLLFLLAFLPTLLQAQNKVYRLRVIEKSMQKGQATTASMAPEWKADSTTLIVVDYSKQVFKLINEDRTISFAWTVEKTLKNHSPKEARGVWEYTCVDPDGDRCDIQLTLMKDGFEDDAIIVIFYSDLKVGYTARLLVD
jgi:hypothetical protein